MALSQALLRFDQDIANLQCHEHHPDAAKKIREAKTVYLLAPSSFLGIAFTPAISQKLSSEDKRVILVDDTLSVAPSGLSGCEIMGTQAFARQPPAWSLAINLANTPFVHGLFSKAAATANIETVDIVPALDAFGISVIYQTADEMRRATLSRLADYADLARKLDDPLSVQTLASILKMRVHLNRHEVLPVLCSLEDEYFSPFPAGKDVTFSMGPDEILCDIGAHVGSTVRKFLSATHWRYAGIYAFEPDSGSFAALSQGIFKNLERFYPRNVALSDVRGALKFAETGTMGSRIDATGNVQVQASTLDDEVPHATFIKMDVEGHETKILQGARQLISESKPRLAITGYHYADDLLEIARLIHEIEPGYRFRLRHHSFYYYDTILYADIAS